MSTLVVGIRPGTRYAGVCVCIDDTVLEAVTVEGESAIPKPERDPDTGKAVPGNPVALVDTRALVGLAGHTWQSAIDIIRDHAEVIRVRCDNPRPLVAVEALVPSRRSPVGRGRVLESVIAQSVNQGALATLLAGQDLVLVPSDEFDKRDPDWYPESLTGPYPREWRGRKGADRVVQRAAWAIAQAGLAARDTTTVAGSRDTENGQAPTRVTTPTPVAAPTPEPSESPTPATPQEYVAALRAVLRTSQPDTPAGVLAAARHALDTVPRPAGIPEDRAPTPLQVAVDAITDAGVAPHLNTPEGRTALAESAGQ